MDYLCRNKIEVECFIDSNASVHGTLLEGKPVISYAEYEKNYSDRPILITAKRAGIEIMNQHAKNEYMIPFDVWYLNREKDLYEKLLFNDQKSYKTLQTVIDALYTQDAGKLHAVVEQGTYFSIPPFWGNIDEVYVDLGACVGDTIESFLNTHCGLCQKIYAFEPGERQLNALKIRTKRLKDEWALKDTDIVIVEGVCGCENGENYIQGDFHGLSVTNDKADGKKKVMSYTLDDYFGNNNITLLKADIEGSEFEMLRGAENLIKRCKPKMAICVYHKPDDLIRVYNLISSWNLNYKFALRTYTSSFMDTVLYCW